MKGLACVTARMENLILAQANTLIPRCLRVKFARRLLSGAMEYLGQPRSDFAVDFLLKAVKKRKIKAKELPKFPSVRRDLALIVDKGMAYDTLKQAALGAERKLLKEVWLFDVYQGKGLEEHEKSYAMAFKLQHPDATLNDKQIESAMSRILQSLEIVGARLR